MEIPTAEGFQVIVENQLYKKIITEGTGELPNKGQEIFALYKGELTNGDVFDSNEDRESPFNFVLGQGSVIKGWDQGFATMKKGEKAILQIGPDFGYGKSGSGKIPANATLVFQVELLNFNDKKKEKWELSDQQKLSESKRLKQEATQAFKKGDLIVAGQLYSDAVGYTEDLQIEEARTLNIALWLNLALVYLKDKKYSKSIQNANKVLQKDSKNIKALYRKGVANLSSQNFDAAKISFDEILSIDPNNNEAKIELVRVKAAIQKSQKRAKDVFSKIFSDSYYEDKKVDPKKEHEHDGCCDHDHDNGSEKPTEADKTPAADGQKEQEQPETST